MGFIKFPAAAEVKYVTTSASVGTATAFREKDDTMLLAPTAVGACTKRGIFSPIVSPRNPIIVPWKALRAPNPALYFPMECTSVTLDAAAPVSEMVK
jgi:hypothetical protein